MSQATSKKLRNKYRFPDRATAEAKLSEVEQEGHLQVRLARALYEDKIEWLGTSGDYRVGLFDHNRAFPKVVQVFAPKTFQEPDLGSFDAYKWVAMIRKDFSCGWSYTKEIQGLLDLADKVSARLKEIFEVKTS